MLNFKRLSVLFLMSVYPQSPGLVLERERDLCGPPFQVTRVSILLDSPRCTSCTNIARQADGLWWQQAGHAHFSLTKQEVLLASRNLFEESLRQILKIAGF